MALLCLGAYSVPSPRIAAKQALSLQCQALNNAAISQKNMLARQNQRDRCHKSAMSIAGLIAQFSRHGHLIDYKYAEKLTVQFVRSASKSYNLMLDQQARFKSLLQRSFTNVSDAEVVNVDRVNQRFSYRVLDY